MGDPFDTHARARTRRSARAAEPSPAPSPAGRSTAVAPDVVAVLRGSVVRGLSVTLPGQLDRKLYQRVNVVLDTMGGKWDRKARAHVFGSDPKAQLASVIASGRIVRPTDLNWYPTPPLLATRLVRELEVRRGEFALEPSAGEGVIAEELRRAGATVQCVEIDPGRAQALREGGFQVRETDFLTWSTAHPRFDVVAANPPFAQHADVLHVLHAVSMLRPGGRLAAIMSAGIVYRQDRKAQELRALVDASGGSIEPLPDGTFRGSGTDVRTVLLTMVPR